MCGLPIALALSLLVSLMLSHSAPLLKKRHSDKSRRPRLQQDARLFFLNSHWPFEVLPSPHQVKQAARAGTTLGAHFLLGGVCLTAFLGMPPLPVLPPPQFTLSSCRGKTRTAECADLSFGFAWRFSPVTWITSLCITALVSVSYLLG